MLRRLRRSEELENGPFGVFCPYWTVLDGEVLVGETAEEILNAIPVENRILDPVGFMELLQFNYMLGDRTLAQGVNRMPWRSVLRGDGVVERQPPIPHGDLKVDSTEVAQKLALLLEREIYEAVSGHSRIYLLLSGGLDSRVVAGVLKRLEPSLKAPIQCVTWGEHNSRDVVYAQRIAQWYDWEFTHIPYDAELTWENITRGAIWGGSEVAGLHLHGTYWFRYAETNSIVLAGSFGDSIGRAEFSSHHLNQLRMLPIQNTCNLIDTSLTRSALDIASRDRARAWAETDNLAGQVVLELDMQENYMRRMICHAMDYIRQFTCLHQVFTSEGVVGLMWSISPEHRTDQIYHEFLRDLDPKLASLPWARTGHAPNGYKELDSSLKKNYHEWNNWLRNELKPRLEDIFFSPGLRELGLFNTWALHRLWGRWLEGPLDSFKVTQNIVKICSLEISRRHFQLQGCREPLYLVDLARNLTSHGFTKVRRLLNRSL